MEPAGRAQRRRRDPLEVGERRESSIGWSYLTNIAHDYGYADDVIEAFSPIDIDADDPNQTPLPAARVSAANEGEVADEFVKRYALKKWIHVPAKAGGRWYSCNNGIWAENDTAPHDAHLIAGEVSDALRTTNARPTQCRRRTSMSSAHAQNAVIPLVKHNPAVSVRYERLDSHLLIMGVPGGFIDEEGRLRDPDPGMLLTRTTGCRPDFDAECPQFDQRVRELANFDKEVEECLWSFMGYTACGLGDQQKFAFLHGKGNEGKTTFFTILGLIFAKYGMTFRPEIFMRGGGDKFSISAFDGAWFAYGNEVNKGEEWAQVAARQASGGGYAPAEKKYMDQFEDEAALLAVVRRQ